MLKWILLALYLALLGVVNGQHAPPLHVASRHRRAVRGLEQSTAREEQVKYDQASQNPATRPARLRADLPVFELIYGQTTEYELGRALEGSIRIRGRPLSAWPYDVQPDLARFSWMVYDRKRRVLSGTPPITQPPPMQPDALSFLDVYVYIGNDRSYRFRTALGIIIHPRNESISSDTDLPATAAPRTSASSDQLVSRPHGVILGMLIAACVLLSLLVLGGLVWIIAGRRNLQNQPTTVSRSPPARNSSHSQEPRGGSITPRGRRSDSHAIPLSSSSAITSTRRRVRTADHGGSPTTPSLQLSPGRSPKNTPEKSSFAGPRKRAATLLQTIHTRAIRGSPRIGSNSKGTLAPSPEVSASTSKAFSPRLGFGQVSPRIGPLDEQDDGKFEERQFTNSWCSALQLDPFQSPGLSIDLTSIGVQEHIERPSSPTPNRGICVAGNHTMSVSELQSSGPAVENSVESSSPFDEGNAFCASTLSFAPTHPTIEDTPVPKSNRKLPAQSFSERSMAGISRDQSYVERTTQLGIALLTPPTTMHTSKPAHGSMGLSFDSFFSPAAIALDEEAVQKEDTPEPRYGYVSSERMVKVGRSQETLATVYITASETGASPVNPGHETSSVGHGIPENIGIIGSPSTLHSQIAELDDISSPRLTVEDAEVTAVATSMKAEGSSQSLSVEYGRADQSLRPLDSFPAMLRGSLLAFPEDVELNTPVLPSSGRSELCHREASDIMLLPADDLTLGCIMLTRIEDVPEQGLEDTAGSIRSAGDSMISAQGISSHLDVRTEEDSILSPDPSERGSEKYDSILGHDSNAGGSADSILSREVDRSSNGLRYASQLFGSPRN